MAKKPAKKDIVADAKAFFRKVLEVESTQRIEEMDDIRFSGLLEQWPPNIKAIREQDPQGARPCLVVDKVNQYKNQIVNNMRQLRPSIKARPVDDYGDEEVADVYQGIIRHIEDASKADIAYDWAGEGAVTSGVGYFRIITEYVGDSFQQEIRIARIRNRFSVYFDPDSREPDGSDAKECLITEKMPRKEFEALYPKCDISAWPTATGDSDWLDKDSARIAEYFWIEKTKEPLYLLEDGNSIFESDYVEKYKDELSSIEEATEPSAEYDAEFPDSEMAMEYAANIPVAQPVIQSTAPAILKQRMGERVTVKWAKTCSGEVLDTTDIVGSFIPVIPVIGIETDVDGKRYLRGIVRGVKDAQRMYNYNRSTIAESLNLTVKAPYIGATGQFKTSGDKWAAANRVNYPYLEYDPVTNEGTMAPPPQRQGYAGVPTGLLQDIETSEHDIQAALGMYQSSIGQDGNAKSGRAINAQQRQGDMATFQFPDNQSKSIRHAGRILMGMIPKIYDTAQVVRILGEDGSTSYAELDPDQQEPVKQMRDENGEIRKIYNLGVGKYDVTITTGASYATKRMEGADFLTQLVQTSPDLMPMIGDLLFKSMDMPYSEEISERMKKMMPPQLQEQDDGTSPEVQQVKQQASQVIQGLQQQLEAAHQAMQEAEQEAQQLEAKANDSQGKVMVDAKRLEIEQYKAETDRLKLQLNEAQSQQVNDESANFKVIMDAATQIVTKAMTLPPEQQEDAANSATEAMQPVAGVEYELLKQTVDALMMMAQNTQQSVIEAAKLPRYITLSEDANGRVTGGVSQVIE